MPSSKIWILDANIGVWSLVRGPYLSPQAIRAWIAGLEYIAVPGLWVYEVTSALYRQGQHSKKASQEIHRALPQVMSIPDEIYHPDHEIVTAAYAWAARLGQGAAYDAFYLALAERLHAEFWTGDRRLYHRARQAGADFVKLLGG